MGDEDFLDAINDGEDEATPATEPKPETVEEQPQAEPEAKPRDENGRFKPKAPEEAAQPEPAPEPVLTEPAPPTPEAQQAPLAALLDERDKRKAAEDRLRAYEAQRAQIEAQPVQAPDMIEDPEGYTAFVNAQVEQRLYGERLFMSERLARIEHGGETFAKAKEWGLAKCDTDPFFNQKVRQSQDPYGVVMDEWKREQAAAIPSDELEQFRAWQAAKQQLAATSPPAPAGNPPSPPSNIPPRSLASAPSAGSALTEPVQDDKEIFEEVIPKG